MNRAWLLLHCATILFVFARVLGIPSCNNCCKSASHKKLSNSRRSVKSLWKPGQTPLCDIGLVSGWYRFTSFVGGKMPTTKVNVNHCGTQYPIWLDGTTGTHPTSHTDPVVHIRACINIAGTGGGCSYSFKVGVKLCEGNFFLYYLRKIHGCAAAYCAGDGVPCPYGKTGPSLGKCSSVLQKFPTRYLGYPVISAKDEPEVEEVSLWCNVSVNEKIRQWKNVTYQIEWYADGKKKKTDWNPKLVGENITSELSGKFSTSSPHYEPGQWVSCTVKARYNASGQLHPWSDYKTILQPFFAGIKVTPSTLTITECKFNISKEITLTPMIPVRKNQDDQFLSVRFYLPKDLWLMSKTNCSIILQDTKSVTVKLGATCSPLRKKKDLITVITPVISNGARSTFWSRPLHGTKVAAYGLPTVWVTVKPVGQQLHKCMSVTDPHIRMLDELDSKKERWHDFFGYGDFLLYRNKERHFEVQTRQWECNRKGITCNCGVIIRDHNDLISFSCCGSPPQYSRDDSTPIMVEIPRQKCLAPGITIRQLIKGINSKYEVIIPTGIKVILSRNYWGIDVTIITPRTKKPEDEDGLCTYTGTAPVITSFAHQYRLSSSYFEKLPLEINNKAKEFVPSCPCDEEKDQGQVNNDCTTDGIPTDWPSFGRHYNRIKMCDNRPMKGRKRRNIEVSDELTKEDYEFFMTPLEYNAHDRIRRSIVSKENATRYCAERLSETLVGKLCAKLGTNVQALVNVCSSDIEYTGDHSFAIGAVAILMNSCTDVIIKRMTNKTSNVTKPTMPPTLQEVADLLCPNDCTFNGKCVNGSCVCNKDYTAKDCSISIYQRPSIARIQGKGLCDRRKRPCKKAAVQGRDFLDSPNMTCHIEEIEIVNSSWTPNRNEKKYRGIMTDLVLMECLLPDTPVLRMRYDENIKGTPAAGLMISVSNNGIDKSDQQLKMISFDSVCMDCNVSTGCSLKKNTCFINHYCFSPNEPNPRDWCQQCIPEVNTNTWTKRQVNLPPNVTSETNYYVVNGEKFKLPIEAIDPEGMSITISLLSESPKDAFIRNNILYWNVTTNQTTHFFFSATDACGASSTFNIIATVNVCQCNNSGECIPQEPRGQGIYTCLCAAGYTGQYCNTEIDECGSYPCLQDPLAKLSSQNLGLPEISYVAESHDVSVTLVCKVAILNGIEKWKNVSYLIEWVSEEKTLKRELICGVLLPGKTNKNPCPNRNLISQLPGTSYRIGQWISCEVSAKFTNSPKNKWSSPRRVLQPFFAGLKVYPTALNLEACDTKNHIITITPTIPVRRSRVRGLPTLSFRTPKEVNILEGCNLKLQEGIKEHKIKITAACGQQVSDGLKLIIPYIHYQNSRFWSRRAHLPTIWVTMRAKTAIEQCSSSGDSHYYILKPHSFGKYFDFMGRGDFILYKNTERYFEVQTRQWRCGGSVTCNCGAVVRDHNDVIEFNCCNDRMERDSTTPIFVKIRSKKCLSPGISIKKLQPGVRNAKYEALFPSGPKVVVQRSFWGMNVYVYTPRAKDTSKESGLCLEPPKTQDPDTYGENLRLQAGQSYFDDLPPPVNDYEVKYSVACQCLENGNKYQCRNAFDYAFPTINKKKLSPMFLCDRDKRNIHFSDDLTDQDIELFKQMPPLPLRRRRETAKQILKEDPVHYCEERISDTKIGKLCAKVGVNVRALVSVCSDDIEFTGDYSYASGGVFALMDQCENLAALNLSKVLNSSNDHDAVNSAGSALVEEIVESLCPNDCSFKGKCVNGSCLCDNEFTADDCSAYIYEIPTILSLQGNGLCDRRTRPCRKVTVLGTGFITSENMTCHVTEFKVVNSGWAPNSTGHKLPGVMTDLVLADCNLPESPVTPGHFHEIDKGTPAAGLVISVSNNGEHKSKENLTFISYDSACMRCNTSSGCSLKESSCFINGYCFAPGDSNPINLCYQCLPAVSTGTWTKRQVNLPPKFSSANQFYALYHEHLELAITVSDTESMPVKVTLMDESPSDAFISDNVLVWKANSNQSTQFMLKATDACHAVSTHIITVSLVVCQCQNNGACIPDPHSPRGSGLYRCNCAPGFTGDACQTDIDECQSYPCLRGRCIDDLNNFSCICDPGYVGRACDTDYDDCSSSPCVHGNCTDYRDSYGCSCFPGYSGENCAINIDDCEPSPCRHGTCIDQVNNYMCQCHAGYTGYDCTGEIDECQSSPCVHDVDECLLNTCANGGSCVDGVNIYSCICPVGYTGDLCETDIDECLPNPCTNGASCVDVVNNYSCICPVGYKGDHCETDIDECSTNSQSCDVNAVCTNTKGSYKCTCISGFSGYGNTCSDIDECVPNPCANGGSCVDGVNNYSCICRVGYTGDLCQTDIDECTTNSHNCDVNAVCSNTKGSYVCTCKSGYSGDGKACSDIDDCLLNACANGGSCVDGVNSYSCICPVGYTGDLCETDIDECSTNSQSCDVNAVCSNTKGSYLCTCKSGYSGDGKACSEIDECNGRTCIHSASECQNYSSLSSLDRNINSYSIRKCDYRIGPGWFRFQGAAGTRMPTSCPPARACSTSAPGWLNGEHPSVADGQVSRTVCFHYFAKCCVLSTTIKVRNCGSFYVYYLDGVPICSLRYCGTV